MKIQLLARLVIAATCALMALLISACGANTTISSTAPASDTNTAGTATADSSVSGEAGEQFGSASEDPSVAAGEAEPTQATTGEQGDPANDTDTEPAGVTDTDDTNDIGEETVEVDGPEPSSEIGSLAVDRAATLDALIVAVDGTNRPIVTIEPGTTTDNYLVAVASAETGSTVWAVTTSELATVIGGGTDVDNTGLGFQIVAPVEIVVFGYTGAEITAVSAPIPHSPAP